MVKILNILLLETKKKDFHKTIFYKNLLAGIFIFYSLFILANSIKINLDVPTVFLRLIPILIVVNNCFILVQEFTQRTDKFMFTGIYTRSEVILSKLAYIILQSFILYLMYVIVVSINFPSALPLADTIRMIEITLIFLLNGATLGVFILFLSVLFKNGVIVGVITYLLFFDLLHQLLSQAALTTDHGIIKFLLQHTPFIITNTGLYILHYSLSNYISLVIWNIILLFITLKVIKNKEI